jgi:hypothetical protein
VSNPNLNIRKLKVIVERNNHLKKVTHASLWFLKTNIGCVLSPIVYVWKNIYLNPFASQVDTTEET